MELPKQNCISICLIGTTSQENGWTYQMCVACLECTGLKSKLHGEHKIHFRGAEGERHFKQVSSYYNKRPVWLPMERDMV